MGVKMPMLAALACLVGLVPSGVSSQASTVAVSLGKTAHASYGAASGPRSLVDFATLAKQLGPAVVNISTTRMASPARVFPSPFGNEDPFGEYSEKFFGDPFLRDRFRRESLGSGFIIDRDGLVLTNNHVVEDAEKITVRLSDGREFDAEMVGKDPKTDSALIKINAEDDLPAAPLGDSDRLEVGEWVLAIGNPFGLEHTVTAGIVSAKARYIGAGPYDDFIQTDASINPGNYGGPMINMQGEVVGVNTAIFSRGGGNLGIGFAIPINLVKEVLPQLKEKGKVTRGWLGAVIQRVTPTIAESLGLDRARGAIVAEVKKDGPADRGGIEVGDVIIEFDAQKVMEANDLGRLVARTAVGDKVRVGLLRDGKKMELAVTVGELVEAEQELSTLRRDDLGLAVQQVKPEIAESLGLAPARGVVVTLVEPGSPADEAGMQPRDIILEIDRKPIDSLSDFQKAIAKMKKGKGVLFLVHRGNTTLFLALKLPQ